MEYIDKDDGAVRRTYQVPEVESLTLDRLTLLGRHDSTRMLPVCDVRLAGGVSVNGKRVHPADLVQFCDAILATFTGEQLERARAL